MIGASQRHRAAQIDLTPSQALPAADTVQKGLDGLADLFTSLQTAVADIQVPKGLVIFEHIQNTPATQWHATHNGGTTRVFIGGVLDAQFASMSISGYEVVSNNEVVITLPQPSIGRAYVVLTDITTDVNTGDPTVVVPNVITHLQDLQDVLQSNPLAGQVLTWNGTKWANTPLPEIVSNLSGLGDVRITAPSNGQVLMSVDGEWVNSNLPTGVVAMDDLSDATIVNPTEGQMLAFINGAWRNYTPSTAARLDDLTDVDAAIPHTLDILSYNGSHWVPRTLEYKLRDLADFTAYGGQDGYCIVYRNGFYQLESVLASGSLNDLSDVLADNVVAGQVLMKTYRGWEPVDIPPTVRIMNDLTDVDVDNPLNGQYLKYDASEGVWRNATHVQSWKSLQGVQTTNIPNGGYLSYQQGSDSLVFTPFPSIPQNVPYSLNGLTDVTITTPVDGHTLVYNSVAGVFENKDIGIVNQLVDLTDMTITNPQGGQFLMYNSATHKWTNTTYTPPAFTMPAIYMNSLSDTQISTPTNGQFLRYFNNKWVNTGYSLSLAELWGVSMTAVAEGQVLAYKDGVWKNTTPSDAGMIPFIPTVLTDLTDVQISSTPTSNLFLRFNTSSGKWVAAQADAFPTLYLNSLANVSAAAANGNILYYNGYTNKWESKAPPEVYPTVESLTDTDINTPAENETLVFKNNKWTNRLPESIPKVLNDLTDVDDGGAPADGDMLSYSTALGKWVSIPRSTIPTTVAQLTDVSTSTAQAGQSLIYDGSKWNAEFIPESSTSLAQLTDVNIGTPQVGNTLVYTASGWVSGDAPLNIPADVLRNVSLSGAVGQNQLLVFKNGAWTNVDKGGLIDYTEIGMGDVPDGYVISKVEGVITPVPMLDALTMESAARAVVEGVGLPTMGDVPWRSSLTAAQYEGRVLTVRNMEIVAEDVPNTDGWVDNTQGTSTASNNSVLSYSTSTGKWQPRMLGVGDFIDTATSGVVVFTASHSGGHLSTKTLSLSDLTDVNVENAAQGGVLKFDGTSWVVGTDSQGVNGANALSELGDVVITTPVAGQTLTFDGVRWVNTDPTEAPSTVGVV
jgi:hypothetical protein